jgi:hypothetical protein
MPKMASFIDRTRMRSALGVAFIISLTWVAALSLLIQSAPTHSVKAGSNPPAQKTSSPTPPHSQP